MNHPASSRGAASPGRDHALDALRTIAVLGMMAAHTARLVPLDARPGWARFVLLIEPLIPSLFLLLVGLSLSRSFAASQAKGVPASAWYIRQLKRAGGLWLVSAVFFTLELGFRPPDVLLAGGILANIAYAIALIGGLLAWPGARARRAVLAGAALAGAALFLWLDAANLRVHPVTIGNAPFLPLWLFALAGALTGAMTGTPTGPFPGGLSDFRAVEQTRTSAASSLGGRVVLGVGLALGAAAVLLLLRYGVDVLFTNPFGRSDAGRLIPAPLFGGEPIRVGYYNLKPVLAATCLGLQLGALALLGGPLARLGPKTAACLFALGRRALTVYILHLALLAALIVISGDRQPLKTGWHGTAVLLGLLVICQGVSLLRRKNNIMQFGH